MIFVCLGNPGEKYQHTRHNAGKKFGEFLCQKLQIRSTKFKTKGKIIRLENNWEVVFLDCLMNESGECLKSILNIRTLNIGDLFIVHDDLDIPFGEYKIQFNRGTAGHKGIKSIVDALGGQDFNRIRIGIGRPPKNISPEDYVLMPFNAKEKEEIKEVFEEILLELKK
jgi:PTH1 family peptidyl-tRNA hydrolase